MKPGTPCLIVNSLFNNGKVVTLSKFLGDKIFRRHNGSPDTVWRAWLLEEALYKPPPLGGPDDLHIIPEFNLKPLDNPGDDAVDHISSIRRKEDECV